MTTMAGESPRIRLVWGTDGERPAPQGPGAATLGFAGSGHRAPGHETLDFERLSREGAGREEASDEGRRQDGLGPDGLGFDGLGFDGLGAVLHAALGLLAAGGRIRLVRPGEGADIVHTVGGGAAARGNVEDGAAHRVHTLPAVPLHAARTLLPGWWWGRRERRRVGPGATWLVHGRVAAQLLVASGAAPGEQVHWLPIVAPLGCHTDGSVDRAAVRARLGVPPGVVLVLECAPDGGLDTASPWERFLAADRRDVMTVRCGLPGLAAPFDALVPAGSGGGHPGGPLDHRLGAARAGRPGCVAVDLGAADAHVPAFPELLAAADLFVAGRRNLTAANPGVAAVAAGVPVIAVTTDSTAELVRSGRNGFVVPPAPAAVAEAVHAYLAGDLPHLRTPVASGRSGPAPDSVLEELARGLLRAYHCALTHHADRRATDRATIAGPAPVPAG
ncbi:hypothetical protein ABH931_004256 [Streptacidiphilus sp. MAP12-33]|uniref:glycosyltransferase n=1 Tax=Streptacidiphilus sp. MAP12-33 TaxID=3156266 RepID=UPI003512D219